jgi:hypothetical protein
MLLKTVTLTADAMMSWECGQDRGDKVCTQEFRRKYLGKCSLGRPRKTWEDIIMIYVREMDYKFG